MFGEDFNLFINLDMNPSLIGLGKVNFEPFEQNWISLSFLCFQSSHLLLITFDRFFRISELADDKAAF